MKNCDENNKKDKYLNVETMYNAIIETKLTSCNIHVLHIFVMLTKFITFSCLRMESVDLDLCIS